MYERIVVPLDGSKLAERALPHAEELARLTGCPIHLIRVIDLAGIELYGAYALAMDSAAYSKSLKTEEEASQTYLARTADELVGRGLTVTQALLRGGSVRWELTEATRPGDVVVMATHGRGGIRRWFLGSVAEELVRHVTVPVLLVRSVIEADAASEPSSKPSSEPAKDAAGVA